jgi:hypothetical protein
MSVIQIQTSDTHFAIDPRTAVTTTPIIAWSPRAVQACCCARAVGGSHTFKVTGATMQLLEAAAQIPSYVYAGEISDGEV